MKVLILLVVIALVIIGFSVSNNSPDTDDAENAVVESVAEESPPEPEPEPAPEPEPEPKYKITDRVSINEKFVLCEKVSNFARILPAPYGDGRQGMIKAAANNWCRNAQPGEIFDVTNNIWDVEEYPIAENWPAGFPLLVKVYETNGTEWWARMDHLLDHTTVIE